MPRLPLVFFRPEIDWQTPQAECQRYPRKSQFEGKVVGWSLEERCQTKEPSKMGSQDTTHIAPRAQNSMIL